VTRKRIVSFGGTIAVAVALVTASGAATGASPVGATLDLSSKAKVHQYLRSIHVNPKGVVIQRGLRNYAGPNCPGKRWTCANTTRTVVQISKRRGKNIFRCTTARCAVVQISKSFADNTASCIKTTGVTQSCTISQPNASGLNKAVVWMDTGKLTGLTQTALYTASITQGPASAAGSTNTNLACVHQAIFIDGSTKTNTNSSNVTVTNEAHQSIVINQNSLAGTNTVGNTLNEGTNSYVCDTSPTSLTSALSQYQELYSLATGKGTVTQKQNAAPNGANLTLDIKQNQGNGFFGNAGGVNWASFKQTNNLTAIANAPKGATQIQSSDTTGGILAAVNQDSSNLSTAIAVQEETQCEDAAPSGLSACSTTPTVISNYSRTQKQFGPAGLGKSVTSRHGRHFSMRKAPGDSFQTGYAGDVFTVSQTSHQFNDTGTGQKNDVLGGITTDGTGTVTQNTLIQTTPKKNVHQGDDTTVNGNINCQSGSPCIKNLSPPTIDSKPPNPDTYGHNASFSFSNVDDTVVFVCSLDGAPDSPCTSPTSYPTPASGSHTFSVKTKDPDNGLLSDAALYTWVITPPDPTISANPPNPSTSTSASFSFTDADPTALFLCQLDAGAYGSCTSGQTYTGLAPGEHTFNVKATDQTGTYESTNAATYTWTIAFIVFDGSPGTGAPPSTLGPYTMMAFGADSQAACTYDTAATTAMTTSVSGPAGTGTIGFDQALNHDHLGALPPECWQTWSHGYTGDVYDTLYSTNKAQVTISLPAGTQAFYFYAEPNQFSTFQVTATAQDGTTSGPVSVNGNAGATYLGFYELGGATLSSITVTTSDTSGFAIGEFGISVAAP
jgi:hypothetical protein